LAACHGQIRRFHECYGLTTTVGVAAPIGFYDDIRRISHELNVEDLLIRFAFWELLFSIAIVMIVSLCHAQSDFFVVGEAKCLCSDLWAQLSMRSKRCL
jgi:hypothetical protein